MTDWIQVLLGQPLEEAREDSLEELNQAAEDSLTWKRRTARRADGAEGFPAAETAEERLLPAKFSPLPEALEEQRWNRNGVAAAGTEKDRPAAENKAVLEQEDGGEDRPEHGRAQVEAGQGAERLEAWLRDAPFPAAETGRRTERQVSSAGAQAARGALGEALVWRQSGAEALEATAAGRQAEWAAAETVRRNAGDSGYLAAALAAPEYRTPPAGRLLAVMEQNDRVAAYRTTAQMTEQVENRAWTGSDPARLDQIFERDARRYDNGFTMF